MTRPTSKPPRKKAAPRRRPAGVPARAVDAASEAGRSPVEGKPDPRFEWKADFSVGIEEIDAQHQELFRRAAMFVDSLRRRSRQEIGILLSFLRLYAVTHFGAEETWMRRAHYPGAEEHARQHDRFIKDILALSEQHEKPKGDGIEPARVAGWLEKWLKHHVTETDTDLARHLRATGTPPPDPSDLPF